MTEIVAIPLSVRRGEVLRCLGYPGGCEPGHRVRAVLSAMLPLARGLVRGSGAALVLPPERATEVGLAPRAADALVLGIATVGPALEARVHDLTARGEIAAALVLDAAGSAAAEEAVERLSVLVVEGQMPGDALRGARVSGGEARLGPGCGSWPLESQRALLDLLPARALGVELTRAMMMIPRKSLTFARWIDARSPNGERGCAPCDHERCAFRRAVPKGVREEGA